jgi:hypothetical protein
MRTDQLIKLLVADLKPVDSGRIPRALFIGGLSAKACSLSCADDSLPSIAL